MTISSSDTCVALTKLWNPVALAGVRTDTMMMKRLRADVQRLLGNLATCYREYDTSIKIETGSEIAQLVKHAINESSAQDDNSGKEKSFVLQLLDRWIVRLVCCVLVKWLRIHLLVRHSETALQLKLQSTMLKKLMEETITAHVHIVSTTFSRDDLNWETVSFVILTVLGCARNYVPPDNFKIVVYSGAVCLLLIVIYFLIYYTELLWRWAVLEVRVATGDFSVLDTLFFWILPTLINCIVSVFLTCLSYGDKTLDCYMVLRPCVVCGLYCIQRKRLHSTQKNNDANVSLRRFLIARCILKRLTYGGKQWFDNNDTAILADTLYIMTGSPYNTLESTVKRVLVVEEESDSPFQTESNNLPCNTIVSHLSKENSHLSELVSSIEDELEEKKPNNWSNHPIFRFLYSHRQLLVALCGLSVHLFYIFYGERMLLNSMTQSSITSVPNSRQRIEWTNQTLEHGEFIQRIEYNLVQDKTKNNAFKFKSKPACWKFLRQQKKSSNETRERKIKSQLKKVPESDIGKHFVKFLATGVQNCFSCVLNPYESLRYLGKLVYNFLFQNVEEAATRVRDMIKCVRTYTKAYYRTMSDISSVKVEMSQANWDFVIFLMVRVGLSMWVYWYNDWIFRDCY